MNTANHQPVTYSAVPSSSQSMINQNRNVNNTRYERDVVQIAQNRQMSSMNGSKRYYHQPQSRLMSQGKVDSYDMATSSQNHSSSNSMYGDDGDMADYGDPLQYGYDPIQKSGDFMRGPISDRPTGLRHFSTKVCEKVKQKGLTNYNEVADELVTEYFEKTTMNRIDMSGKHDYEMKNIRRRVYDALNVLLAMNIITKNKKDIRWLGLPASSAQEIVNLENQKAERERSIKAKLESIHEMVLQLVTYKNLVAMNKEYESVHGRPDQHSLLYLPFLIVNTNKEAMVDCSVSSDKSEYLFSFDRPFEIHDDLEVLKRLGLCCGLDTNNPSPEDIEKAKSYLPELLKPYVDDILMGARKAAEERERMEEQQRLEQEEENRRKAVLATRPRPYQPNADARPVTYNRVVQENLEEQERGDSILVDEKNDMMISGSQRDPGRLLKNLVPHTKTLIPSAPALIRTTANSPNPAAKRYYIQKPAQQIIRQREPIRQISRPYAVGSPSGAAAPKYYLSSGQHRQPQYVTQQYSKGPPNSEPRTIVRSQYGTAQPTQTRVVQQRIVHPLQGQPGTIVRKIVKRIVVPQKAGQQFNQQPQHQPRVVHRIVHSSMPQNSNQMDMPMSSRQSDMIQEQHVGHQQQQQQQVHHQQQQNDFDQFYDPLGMGDDQLMNDVSNDLGFQ